MKINLKPLFLKRSEGEAPKCCGQKMGVAKDFNNQFVCEKCGNIIVRPDKDQLRPRKMEEQTKADYSSKGWPIAG